jgi:hypothetical protein
MFMVPLMRRVCTERLETVYADRAYITRDNVQFIADAGAYPAIEPKRSSSINARSHRTYGQLLREYREGPEEWRMRHGYGRRSLVESVFSMMKVLHGGCLSSRGAGEGRRELLTRLVLHNIERLNYMEYAGR